MLPTLSARWSLNYAQAGALFTAQYVVSTLTVALSGVLVARWGFRFAIKTGLVLMSAGVGLLLVGPRVMGILCIGLYGGGLGLAVPAGNLLVAEANPGRRSATLNLLNFCWSAGAVACPFLVAAAVKGHQVQLFLAVVAGFALLMAIGIGVMPASIVEPTATKGAARGSGPVIPWKHPALLVLAALFFLYVGVENGFGGWVASYAKSLGSLTPTMAVMTPSFFYAAMMLGRWLAPLLLRLATEIRLVQIGLLVACAGMAGLVLSHGLRGVVTSACLAGLGLSYVYPITISLLSREFGPDSSRLGSIMFTLSNIGGGLLPWMVGVSSTRFGSLKAGLAVPLIGCVAIFGLYCRDWSVTKGELDASVPTV
jgi:fucose permease